MITNNIIIALRNLWRQRLFSLINIAGVTVGIISITLIFLYVQHELTYNKFLKNFDRIYALEENGQYPQNVFPALPVLKKEYPLIEDGTRILTWYSFWLQNGDKESNESIMHVDTGFFNVFSFPLIYGDPATALKDKHSLVLSEEVAIKLFGKTNPVGKVLQTDEEGRQYTVTGVMASIPTNSTIRPDAVASVEEIIDEEFSRNLGNWYNSFSTTFLLLKPDADPHQLELQLPDFIKRYYEKDAQDRTLALLSFETLFEKYYGNSTYVYALLWIALFILAVVSINFINLTTAVSFGRMREIAVRRVIGSSRGQLVGLFLTESLIVSLFSVVLGLSLVSFSIESVNKALHLELSFNPFHNWPLLACLAGVIFILGLCAGVYPALRLATAKLGNAIKGEKAKPGAGAFRLRNSLIVMQFVIAVVLIVSSITVFQQVHYMKTADLHFDKDNVLIADLALDYRDPKQAQQQINRILDKLKTYTKVKSYSITSVIPGHYFENYNSFYPAEDQSRQIRLRHSEVDEGYLDTYGIKLLEGRNFSSQLATDTLEHSVMINEAAMKALGWTDIQDKSLKANGTDAAFKVIGVMDDFHYQSLENEVEPLLHAFTGPISVENKHYLGLRIAPGSAREVIGFLEGEWKQIASRKPFSYFFVDEDFNRQYEALERTLLLIAVFTVVTILIACAGIFGLTVLISQWRVKEIGVRKVLGASVSSIVGLLSKDFLLLVFFAFVIGAPLAWYAAHTWLKDFAYPTPVSWWFFGLAGFLALAIALVTISVQGIRAATANPIKALRSE